MTNLDEDISTEDTYSEEVQEIIGRDPDWLIRWGITGLFIGLFSILLCTLFINYPDTIAIRIILTTQNPPFRLVAHTNGKIIYLIKDNSKIKKNDLVAYIDNSSNFNDVKYVIDSILNRYQLFDNPENSLKKAQFKDNLKLGELQDAYQKTLNAIIEYRSFFDVDLSEQQRASLEKKKAQYVSLNQQLINQCNNQKQALDIVTNRYELNKKIYAEKVISDAEFESIKLNFINAKKAYDISRNNILDNQITITQVESEIISLSINKKEKSTGLKEGLINSLKLLESQTNQWKDKYLIVSSVAGQVSIPKFFETNQNVNINDEVSIVIPADPNIYGQILLPSAKSGKIDIGQKVNIKLDNYPSNEYGMIIGTIKSISAIPQNDLYTIEVNIPKSLKTTYLKKITFKQLMAGNAEIVTKDKSLFTRIFNQFQSIRN